MASASAFQAEDASSILVTRSKKINEKFGYFKNYLYLCIAKQIRTWIAKIPLKNYIEMD